MLAYLLSVHVSAVLLIKLLALHWLLTGLLSVLIIASLLYYCRCHGWLFQVVKPSQLWLNQDSLWCWSDHYGREQGAMRLTHSVILGPVIAIYCTPLQSRFSRAFVIARDAVNSEDWRRLRVKLRDPESWG